MERTARLEAMDTIARTKRRRAPITLAALIPDCAMLAASALLASFAPFEGVSPFGAACIMAAWYSGLNPYFACVGAIAGSIASGSYALALVCAVMGAAVFFVSGRTSPRRIYRLLILFGAEAAALIPASLIFRQNTLLMIGGSTVSVFAAVVIGSAVRSASRLTGGGKLSDAGLLTLSATAGLIILAMRSFNISGQSPAMILAGVCVLFASYRLGIASCAFAVTVGAGRVLASGSDMHFIALLSASALIASSVRGLGKWACLAAFAVTNLLFTTFVRGVGVFSWFEYAAILLIFAAVPQKLYMTEAVREGIDREAACPRCGGLQYRVAELSDALNELAEASADGRTLRCVAEALKTALSPAARRSVRFTAEYGSAVKVKPGSAMSGDSRIVRSSGGRLLLALSDGMGSGEAAGEESRSALRLLSDLTDVGFGLDDAAELVNDTLSRRGSGDMYATLDVILIDMADGTAGIKKHGAPPGYVLRGGKLYTLQAEGLPVGIVEKAPGSSRKVRLKPGDTVIMMTDGVADALASDAEDAIRANILGYGDPEIAAQLLLDEAAKRGRSDDMTVLVARLKEKRK